MKHTLIVVNGFSCTGKTTLARKISEKYSIPMFSADDIKETIMDNLGAAENDASRKNSFLSYDIMYNIAYELLKNRLSVIIESSFHNTDENIERINNLSVITNAVTKQLFFLTPDTNIVWERMQNRKHVRHPSHIDISMTYEELSEKVKLPKYDPLAIDGKTYKIENSDFSKINYQEIYKFLES